MRHSHHETARGRPRRRRAAIAAALLLISGVAARPARAQEFHEHVAHPCQDFWFLARPEIYACLQRDLAAADAELNRVYRERMDALAPERRARLQESQRAWLVRYDAVLTGYYARPWAGHSMVMVLPSQIRALRDRTAVVRAFR
ncbi:MAG TPA: lysozyme inhibitor LprI family protein [Longimicrobium sp.]|nr:lysozyme inhibitor LprI family protein [Longimicrobium sp.]